MPLLESYFVFVKHKIVVLSFDVSFGLTWRMLAPCYDYTLVTLSLYDHLVFGVYITLCFDQYVLSLCMIMAIMLS